MARAVGYAPSLFAPRPRFDADGVVVARRPITIDRAYAPGDVIEGLTPRQRIVYQRNFLIDTLPVGTKVVGDEPSPPAPAAPTKPQPQKAASPRGR